MKKVTKNVTRQKNLRDVTFQYYNDGCFGITDKWGKTIDLSRTEAGALQRFIFSRFQYSK